MNSQDQDPTDASPAADSAAVPADQRLTRWQAYARQRRSNAFDTFVARLLEPAEGSSPTADKVQQALRWQLGGGLINDLLLDCADWRGEKPGTVSAKESAIIEAAMVDALAHLLPSGAPTIAPQTGTQLYRWLIPSLGGGLLGVLLLGADGIGGVLSALLGSAGGVAGVVWLASHPETLDDPIRATGSDSPASTPAFPFPRLAWLQGPGQWLLRKARGLARGLAARLVQVVLPPPVATLALSRVMIASACERAFNLLITLVFICCVTRADSGTAVNRNDPDPPITEGSVLRALLALVRAVDRQPEALETVRDLADELHQRLLDAGYAWEVIPDGTLFEDEHRKRFHLFGLVAPGEPVATLEPCFRRGEFILLPGRITKQRD